MSLSTTLAAVAVGPAQQSAIADADGFELDVRIVESGPVASVLLASTDDGCNTVKTSDC